MNNITKPLIILYLFSYSVFLYLFFTDTVSIQFLYSAVYAGLLNFVNTLTAVILFKKSYKSGNQKFMIFNLGGMGIRLMLLLILFVIVIKFLNIDEYAFILVFFLFYFISLTFEVLFYLKKSKK